MRRALLLAVLVVGACDREPRSPSYFIAHPEEADVVLRRCEAGEHRGPECLNAQASREDRQRKARMEYYRRGIKQGVR